MTKEEAIKHLEFMAKGYQNLLDNDERCLEAVGKGYKGEVEAQESLADVYKAQIDALNLAIKALEKEPSKESKKCIWIKYDYRTICPKECGGENPYWRIPENMENLKYCPYCGREIEVQE